MPEQAATQASPATAQTFDLEGDFDRRRALQVGREILQLQPSARLQIDFHRVHFVQDSALVILADALRRVGPTHVVVHGLSHHHEMILHYLGVDLARFGE